MNIFCAGENETNCIINGIIEFFINVVAHALIGSDEIELVFLQIAQFKSWFFLIYYNFVNA